MAYEGNRYAGLNRNGPDDKSGWLGTAGTVAGAGLGLLAGPGGIGRSVRVPNEPHAFSKRYNKCMRIRTAFMAA